MMVISLSMSCDNEDVKVQNRVESIDYDVLNLNVQKKISAIGSDLGDKSKISSFINRYVGVRKVDFNERITYNNGFTFHISLPSHYSAKEKDFMLGFYNELANCYDDRILDMLSKKSIEVNSRKFSVNFQREVNFIIYTFKGVTDEVFEVRKQGDETNSKRNAREGLLECLQKKGASGKDIGRNLVLGAVAGAYGGATAGTFTVPVLGTAVGAVGGAVFGGAAGAVSGVVTSLVWPAIDCFRPLFSFEENFLKDEYFDEIMELDLTEDQKEEINILINLPPSDRVLINDEVR